MLVSINIENYKSFAEKQCFSLVSGVGATRNDRHSFSTGNSIAPQLLRSSCVFGANGSGKSNLVLAIDFVKNFILNSAKESQKGEEIKISSFKFDAEWREKPTEIEISFIYNETFYQYGFVVDKNRVWAEWLFVKGNEKNSRIRRFFEREYDVEKNEYRWYFNSSLVKGAKDVWKKATRDNALFISTAVLLNAEVFEEPFEWFQKKISIIKSVERVSPRYTIGKCIKDGWKDKILNLLQSLDVNIIDFDFEEEKFDVNQHMNTDVIKESVLQKIQDDMSDVTMRSIKKSYHKTTDGKTYGLNFRDESDGSRLAFGLSGIWLDVLERGKVLVIDELHNSLHPHALKFLVNMFHDPKINKNNAQLIFTSHETSIMSKGFMHKDQIWLVEKDEIESSLLFPLSDYKGRDISLFQKSYLDGRYGAVPKLKGFFNA